MKPLERSDLLNLYEYEKARESFRRRVIDQKRHRRVHVGPNLTFVFENRLTVLFQIQEMMRIERIVDDSAIDHELDTYNRLLPRANELAATMLVEITEKGRIREILDSLVGLPKDAVFLTIGEKEIATEFDLEQSSDSRISAVQYVRWTLTDADIERFRLGASDVAITVRHPNYWHYAVLTSEQRESIARDLVTSDLETDT